MKYTPIDDDGRAMRWTTAAYTVKRCKGYYIGFLGLADDGEFSEFRTEIVPGSRCSVENGNLIKIIILSRWETGKITFKE